VLLLSGTTSEFCVTLLSAALALNRCRAADAVLNTIGPAGKRNTLARLLEGGGKAEGKGEGHLFLNVFSGHLQHQLKVSANIHALLLPPPPQIKSYSS
jgi:hypothetical protein